MAAVSRSLFVGILVAGVVSAIVSFVLLVTASVQKKWIIYKYTITSGVTSTVVDVDIGLWMVEGTAVTTVFGNTVTTDISGDSTDYDYFDKNLIKCCRAFSIIGCLLLFTSVVLAILVLSIHKFAKPFLAISVATVGITVVLLMVSLILVVRELKDGMSVSVSYRLGIVVNVLSVITTVLFTIVLVLYSKGYVRPSSVDHQSTNGDKM